MKRIVLMVAIVFAVVSCDKNQKVVKKLDGKWNATKVQYVEDGKTLDMIGMGAVIKYEFKNCKLEDNEYCEMSVATTFNGATDTENSVFKVIDDGATLVIAESDTASTTSEMNIVELKNKSCILKQTQSTGEINIELEKE
ncbi:MAG: hypothetical protein ACWA41_10205 [Putridiphycobacter sp.]